MLNGKSIYSEIFSHHQPFMVYMSYFLQLILNPENLYELISYHRIFIIISSLFFNLLILIRFRKKAFIFIIFFEIAKFYYFGNLFLGEILVAYSIAYILGITYIKFKKQKLYSFDYFISALLLFLICITREPYIPAAILIILYIYLDKNFIKIKVLSIFTFISLSLLFFSTLPLKEYFHAMFELNFNDYIKKDLENRNSEGFKFFKIFFYPFLVLINNKYTISHLFLLNITILFLAECTFLFKKNYKYFIFLFLIFGLLSIRFVSPEFQFHRAFYLLPWLSAISIITSFLFYELYKDKKNVSLILGTISFIVFLILMINSFYFNSLKLNRTNEFHNNYGNQYILGETIKILSSPQDKLMIDYWETLIYWQSNLESSYKYSMYWPVMKGSQIYYSERKNMFANNPPDFYYTFCGKNQLESPLLSKNELNKFIHIKSLKNKPTCLYINKNKFKSITDDKWKEIERLGFKKPEIKN